MKNLLYTNLFMILISLLLIVGCSNRRAEVEDARIADKSRPLIFVTHPTQPPCSYLNSEGECVGTDVDLARKIAAKMGRGLVCEVEEFESLITRLKNGTADFAIATITITASRQRDVNFSVPYLISGSCFLYQKDHPKPLMSQISSLRIGVESGTTSDIYLCLHGCDPVRYANIRDAMGDLQTGKIDAIFFDAITLESWSKQSGGRLIVSPLATREGYGVAVDKRRPDVLAAANEVIIAEGASK